MCCYGPPGTCVCLYASMEWAWLGSANAKKNEDLGHTLVLGGAVYSIELVYLQ